MMSDLTDRLRRTCEAYRALPVDGIWARLTIDRDVVCYDLSKAADYIDAYAKELDRQRVTIKMLQDDKAALREQLTLAESVRAAQVAGLTEGLEKVRRDAARYRWLRDWAQSSDWEYIGWQSDTDKAVDAAMKGEA